MNAPVRARLAHLSDPHFGTVVPAVREALLRELNDSPPDLIVLTGDITQRARRAQFREAAAFLDALPRVPVVCLPGNHDVPLFDIATRVFAPYRNYRRYISPALAPLHVTPELAVLCVDATRRSRHKHGVLDDASIARAAARLATLRQPFRIVATHQPLAAVVDTDLRNVARGASSALDRWITAGADLFLGGHIHLPYCLEVHTADRRNSSVLLQAGTCLSHRIRNGIPNSWNLVTLMREAGERRMRVERRDYDATSGRFATVHLQEAVSMMDRRRTGLNGWRLPAQS